MFLNQSNYTKQIIKSFKRDTENSVSNPSDVNKNLGVTESTIYKSPSHGLKFPYQEAVVSILYLSQTTRLDICFATGNLSRIYTLEPEKKHLNAVKRGLHYLIGTESYGLKYKANRDLISYCSVDHANDVSNRKSVSLRITYFYIKVRSYIGRAKNR